MIQQTAQELINESELSQEDLTDLNLTKILREVKK